MNIRPIIGKLTHLFRNGPARAFGSVLARGSVAGIRAFIKANRKSWVTSIASYAVLDATVGNLLDVLMDDDDEEVRKAATEAYEKAMQMRMEIGFDVVGDGKIGGLDAGDVVSNYVMVQDAMATYDKAIRAAGGVSGLEAIERWMRLDEDLKSAVIQDRNIKNGKLIHQ